MVRMVRIVRIVRMVWMVTMVTMVVIFYEVRLSRTCVLISRRRSKPQCGSINLCNPFARSARITFKLCKPERPHPNNPNHPNHLNLFKPP